MIASLANNRIIVLLEIWRQNHYKIFILTPKFKKVIEKKKLANNDLTLDNLYLCFKLVTMIASFANNRIVVLLEIWRQNHYNILILTPKFKKVINN